MEILRYTDEHHAFRERLRSFLAGEVTPFAGRWEEEKIVPKSVWQKMGRAGERQIEDPKFGLTHNLGGFPAMNVCSISIVGRYGE